MADDQSFGRRASDRRAPTPSSKQMTPYSGMQIALAIIALSATPITAWLFIADYVDAKVSAQSEDYDQKIRANRLYVGQLCYGLRAVDPTFSCESPRGQGPIGF